VVMSAAELLTMSEAERGAHVQAIRQRLDELHRHLRIALPAYVLLTKCDLLAGFNESFDDLGQEGRAQVWGATFELEDSRAGSAAARLGVHLEALLERLRDRSVLRIEQER